MIRSIRHRSGFAVVTALVLVGSSAAASRGLAQVASEGDVAVLTGPARVREGESLRSLVVLRGPTRIDGVVTGDVIAVGGDVEVSGTVGGDLIAMSGRVRLAPGASVLRDVVSPHSPELAPGARVGGAIRQLELRVGGVDRIVAAFVSWLAMTVSLAVLALVLAALVPARAAEVVYLEAHRTPGRALGLGLVVALATPALAWAAMITLVGIPIGLAFLLALALVAGSGYVTAAWLLGRALTRLRVGDRWAPLIALLAGLAVLRLAALVPIADVIAWIGASAFGLGAALLALGRVRRRLEPIAGAGVAAPSPVAGPPIVPKDVPV